MSEQIQVRPGVWLTREGEEIEVRARDMTGNESSEWRWEGKRRGHYNTWRDDGTIHIAREHKEGDLVKFLRPLPEAEPEPEPSSEPQTTTDTLAEIEGQTGETLQEALGQALERAHIDDMRRVIDALTAERDRLQREHQTMTEHAAELLESAQQARENRDSLQQQLASMTSERDEIATELLAMTDHCSQQQEQLQATTADRDRLAGELANAQHLAADLRSEVDFVRTQKTSQEHELRGQIDRLQRELRDARIEIDAAAQDPGEAAKDAAHEQGFDRGQAWAFSAVHSWVRPLVGASPDDAAAVLQALPGCIRRLAEREGVTL